MNKIIKTITFVTAIPLIFFITSCMNNVDVEERTAETEKQELNEALSNLQNKGYNVDTTKLGVYYIMSKTGTGPFPVKGDTCSLIYTGYFLNGTIFDASYDHYQDSIWQFNYLDISLIPGFNDGIALLNKGAEADIIIPSAYAYGATGYGGVPPYTPLVFNLKMRDLKPKL